MDGLRDLWKEGAHRVIHQLLKIPRGLLVSQIEAKLVGHFENVVFAPDVFHVGIHHQLRTSGDAALEYLLLAPYGFAPCCDGENAPSGD